MITELAPGSLLTGLKCSQCGTVHESTVVQTVCINCASRFFVQYDLTTGITKDILPAGMASMWRYPAFLPVINNRNIVTPGEGLTPIIPVRQLKKFTTGNDVFWKDESGNPTGSFKARGISAAV